MKKRLLFTFLGLFLLFTACNPPESQNSDAGSATVEDSNSAEPGPDSEPESEAEANRSPAPDSRKKELLSSLVGEHKLADISGFAGANTMYDFAENDGEWSASGSSNYGGMREGYEIELSEEQQNKLKTTKITVAADLDITFSCGGKTYFTAPFKAAGMEYLLKGSPADYHLALSENLTPETTFLDGILYLYARDSIPASEIAEADITEVYADALVLKYYENPGEFELVMIYGGCCDNAIYTFR